jgi:two-component system, chemotaxis family, CheB/CheR fusion protein
MPNSVFAFTSRPSTNLDRPGGLCALAEARQEGSDLVDLLLEIVDMPLVVVHNDLSICAVNTAFCALTGCSAEQLRHCVFTDLTSTFGNMEAVECGLAGLNQKGPTSETECRTKNARGRAFRFTFRPAKLHSDQLIVIAVEELTALRNPEMLVEGQGERAAHIKGVAVEPTVTAQELRALTTRLFATQEDERRRIACELHDDVSQKLALLEMDAQQLLGSRKNSIEEMRNGVQILADEAGAICEDIRLVSHALHPSIIEHLGLVPALHEIVEQFNNRQGIVATFSAIGVPGPIPRETAIAVYRIAQESLRNVAKHAGRACVQVSLIATEDKLRLIVEDSGRGFNAEDRARLGLGLLSMQERAQSVKGTLHVVSKPNEGTTVEVEISLVSVL